jgi:GTPase
LTRVPSLQVHFRAGRGGNGEGKNCFGRSGQDVTVHVPLGTVIKDAETGQTLAEVLTADQPRLVLKGGRGGRGNASFKSNRVRAPLMSEKGESALETWLLLELQVVADVGIVGMPNAGKSTLLASLSAARPKVASYAFTTLVPNLGVCEQEYSTTVFADIPGLVEGAHLGIGLGHQFLRHVMRCRVLVHLLDGAQAGEPLAGEAPAPAGDADPAAPVRERGADAIIGAFHAIQTELAAFSPDLATKPQVVVLNKLDLPACRRALPAVTAYFAQRGQPLHIVSAATGEGVTDMVRAVRALLADLPAAPLPGPLSREEAARPVAADLVASREGDISDFRVFRDEDDGAFVVESAALARFVQMTNWEFFESVQRFSYVLKRIGVWSALKAAGCKDGDTVVVGNMELEWQGQDDPGQLYDNWRRSGLGGTTRGARHWPHAGA